MQLDFETAVSKVERLDDKMAAGMVILMAETRVILMVEWKVSNLAASLEQMLVASSVGLSVACWVLVSVDSKVIEWAGMMVVMKVLA